MAGEIDSDLREEILECQKTRSEFIRWKLILVAVLGSASFGLTKDATALPHLMALVPLVCIYVDSVCLHNDSRIMMIAEFLRTSEFASKEARAYEVFCDQHRKRFYNESLALFGSSLFLSLGVAVSAVLGSVNATMDPWLVTLRGASGVLGVGVTIWLLVINWQINTGKMPSQLLSTPTRPPARS